MRSKGQVLLFALLLLGIFSIILGSLGAIWHSRWQAYQMESDGLRAFHIAEAGLELGRAQIIASGATNLTNTTQIFPVTEPSGEVTNGRFQMNITVSNGNYGSPPAPVTRFSITSLGSFKSAKRMVGSSVIGFADNGTLISEPGSWQEL
jgi:type II secretory pathway component PulK